MAGEFQVSGTNAAALFTLKLHRGDGMALLAMNWKHSKPPNDFVGFAIEYKEPGGDRFFALNNRITFPEADHSTNPAINLHQVLAHPEIPLGAFPAQRQPGWRVSLPRHAGVHG